MNLIMYIDIEELYQYTMAAASGNCPIGNNKKFTKTQECTYSFVHELDL